MAHGEGRRRTVVAVAVVVLLLVGAAGGYLLGTGRGDGKDTARADASDVTGAADLKPGVPTIVSLKELEDIGAQQGPIYWAGPRDGSRYEVTVTTEGGTYVRYLPSGVAAGSKNLYLTVGTYAALDGFGALSAAKKKTADVALSKSGAVIATFHSAPLSTYFAFPKTAFQVEVFSPVDGESRRLTDSGEIRLVPDR